VNHVGAQDENAKSQTAGPFLKVPGTRTEFGDEVGDDTTTGLKSTNIAPATAPIPVVQNGELIPGYIAALQRPEAVRFVTARESV